MPTAPLTLDELTSKVDNLPPLPSALLKVMHELERENVNADDLAQIIKLDPDLTAQLLKLSNSAYYGLSRQIGTVKEAIAILGLKTLKSLVYAIISHNALDKPVRGYALEKGALWKNALTGAVYARYLAERQRYRDPETVFTAALLRDLGKIVLEAYVGEQYDTIEDVAKNEKIDFRQAEQQVLGFSHSDVGCRIAEKWNLPKRMLHVMRFHHTPTEVPDGYLNDDEQTLVALVHLADGLALMMGAGVGGDGLMYTIEAQALEHISLAYDNETVEQLLGELVALDPVISQLVESLT